MTAGCLRAELPIAVSLTVNFAYSDVSRCKERDSYSCPCQYDRKVTHELVGSGGPEL